MKYFLLRDDVYFPLRWHLGEIIQVEDNWLFTAGNPIQLDNIPDSLQISLYKDGIPMDYTTNGAFSVPVVSDKIRLQLDGVKGLQFIPVEISSKNVFTNFFIMVVGKVICCVDEEESVFGKFVKNDPIRPDKEGQYSWFTKLIIKKDKAQNEDVFRIKNAENYIIISERVKAALEDVGATGADLQEV
jgi:hypothetical protein